MKVRILLVILSFLVFLSDGKQKVVEGNLVWFGEDKIHFAMVGDSSFDPIGYMLRDKVKGIMVVEDMKKVGK